MTALERPRLARPLAPEQAAALNQISDFLGSHLRQYFVLHGLAGTGKSYLLAAVAEAYSDAILAAPTGKAAAALRAMTGRPASTVHGTIYKLIRADLGADGRPDLEFAEQHDPGALRDRLVLLDEAAMVNEQMARDLLRTGARVIAAGDPGQLPPVTGRPFFVTPDAELLEIHRQALDSPIIRQAHSVRETGRYTDDGPQFRVVRQPSGIDYEDADVVLCWSNETRRQINRRVRGMRGFRSQQPEAGEQIVCLKNAHGFGLFNGGVHTMLAPYDAQARELRVEVERRRVIVPRCDFIEDSGPFRDDCVSAFDFGYALTVHKSQGSQWPFVILIDDCCLAGRERRRWVYTGITRAQDRIVIARTP